VLSKHGGLGHAWIAQRPTPSVSRLKRHAFGRPEFVFDLTPFPDGKVSFSIDIGDPAPAPLTPIDASLESYIFEDNTGVLTRVVLNNFSSDDVIAAIGTNPDDYAFLTIDPSSYDLIIATIYGTVETVIVIPDILDTDLLDPALYDPIKGYDYETVALAAGDDFMTFTGSLLPPNECVEQSIDVGSVTTEVTANVGADAFYLADDAASDTNVVI